VGIDFEKGGEVTFSADVEPLRNFKFILEDRETNTFTELNSAGYTVNLPLKLTVQDVSFYMSQQGESLD
jgi:hypothetical protein